MGNYQSCFSCPQQKPSRSAAYLLDPQGNLCQLQLPIGVAELMLDFPGFIVSSATDLHRTGRIVGLRADDDLVAGKRYLMVPGSKINCKVTEAEMAVVEAADTGKLSGGQGKLGVFWEEKDSKSTLVSSAQQKCSRRRQWNPALEPILED